MNSPVTARHDAITRFLDNICGPYLKHRKLGVAHGEPYTMRLEPGLDREPDLFLILEAHCARIRKNYLDGPADLAIEVISTESRRRDLQEKPAEYARHGVPEYWVVDHERRALHRHRLEGAAYRVEALATGTIEPAAFPGLRIDVAWLWQDPLPDEYTILRQLLG